MDVGATEKGWKGKIFFEVNTGHVGNTSGNMTTWSPTSYLEESVPALCSVSAWLLFCLILSEQMGFC